VLHLSSLIAGGLLADEKIFQMTLFSTPLLQSSRLSPMKENGEGDLYVLLDLRIESEFSACASDSGEEATYKHSDNSFAASHNLLNHRDLLANDGDSFLDKLLICSIGYNLYFLS